MKGLTRPRNLDWIKLDITILSTIVLLSVFFTGLVFLVCQSEFCLGLWIKSCRLVNYCTIRAIVKIKMLRKVVFGTFRPIVNRSVLCTKRGTARGAEKRAGGAGNGRSLGICERACSTGAGETSQGRPTWPLSPP